MRPSSISLSKDALAYSRIVSLSWLEAAEGGEGARGRGGTYDLPTRHVGTQAHMCTSHIMHVRVHVLRVRVQCERDKDEVGVRGPLRWEAG